MNLPLRFVPFLVSVVFIAQGVESEEQVAMLLEDKVQAGQGYLFGKPDPAGLIL